MRKQYPEEFPSLNFSNRGREFDKYTEGQRAAVIYAWLVSGQSTRNMDVEILGLNYSSKGWQSFGICHYLGLDRSHQGFFMGCAPNAILAYLKGYCTNPDYVMIYYYLLNYIQNELPFESVSVDSNISRNYPEHEVKGQNWICNSLVLGVEDTLINWKLLSLPDNDRKIKLGRTWSIYSDFALYSSLKDLYDFRCQVCNNVIRRTGWSLYQSRINQWKYLDAEIHHIVPLEDGGANTRLNMLCLCPTCHKKFNSGELRIITQMNKVLISNELLGYKDQLRNILHTIQID